MVPAERYRDLNIPDGGPSMKDQRMCFAALLFAAVFGFAFGLVAVEPAHGGSDLCCVIPATEFCSEGIGVWFDVPGPNDYCAYIYPYGQDSCATQLAPECW